MFKFYCPQCQQKISAESDPSGLNVQCPTCGVDFIAQPFTDEAATESIREQTTATENPPSKVESSEVANPESGSEPGKSSAFAKHLSTAKEVSRKVAKVIMEWTKVGCAGLKSRSKQAALKAQIEKLRNIDLRKAFHSLGKAAFEQSVLADELAENFQAIKNLDAQIAEMREKAVADNGETKMAAMKRFTKDTAKTGHAKALTVKREHMITELGREIHSRKLQIDSPELSQEFSVITDIEQRIRSKEEEIRGLDDGGKGRIQTLTLASCIVILISLTMYFLATWQVDHDITNPKAVSRIIKNAVPENRVGTRMVGDQRLYYFNKKPKTGWISMKKYVSPKIAANSKFRYSEVLLLHVIDGKIDKEWSFYGGGTTRPKYEIIYDKNYSAVTGGREGVRSFRVWTPKGELCTESKVEDGNGKAFEYDLTIDDIFGLNSNNNIIHPPTKLIHYKEGRISNIVILETEASRRIATQERKNKEYQENKGRTPREIRIITNIRKAYPTVSHEESYRIANRIFGVTSNDLEFNQRMRIIEDIILFAENTKLNKPDMLSEIFMQYRYWLHKYVSLFTPSSSPDLFNYTISKMVAKDITSAMSLSSRNEEASRMGKDLGWKVPDSSHTTKSVYDIVENSYSIKRNFVEKYPFYLALSGTYYANELSPRNSKVAEEIILEFEKAEDDSTRAELEERAKAWYIIHRNGIE